MKVAPLVLISQRQLYYNLNIDNLWYYTNDTSETLTVNKCIPKFTGFESLISLNVDMILKEAILDNNCNGHFLTLLYYDNDNLMFAIDAKNENPEFDLYLNSEIEVEDVTKFLRNDTLTLFSKIMNPFLNDSIVFTCE